LLILSTALTVAVIRSLTGLFIQAAACAPTAGRYAIIFVASRKWLYFGYLLKNKRFSKDIKVFTIKNLNSF
jgi:hypothetical protein